MSRWFLGPPRWSDLEAVLSDRPVSIAPPVTVEHTGKKASPASTCARDSDNPAPAPYAELHAHSHFSFLDGAASPEDMVSEAVRLELSALALIDHDGFYGAVRFMKAAADAGLATVYGAELSLGFELCAPGPEAASPERSRAIDPEGEHLVVLARGIDGYRELSALMARAHLAGGEKGKPRYRRREIVDAFRSGNLLALTGCRKSPVPAAARAQLATGNIEQAAFAAARALSALVDAAGAKNVAVELPVSGDPCESELHDALAQAARIVREERGLSVAELPVVASTNAHYARPEQKRLADVHAALRASVDLSEIDGYLPSGLAHLRSGAEMHALVPRYPQAIGESVRLAETLACDLSLAAPSLPPAPTPSGYSEKSWLRELAYTMGRERYGDRDHEKVSGAWAQIDHELQVIEDLEFPGYFLIVYDIVRFCRENGILCQGRGSAANSAVCFCLGITSVDPVLHGLLFERFLAPERDGPPDIDIDIASDRREEVIQYVYNKYGRENAAQVANVISYQARLAVRDAARALGYSAGQQDAFSKQIERSFSSVKDSAVPADVVSLAQELRNAPRHLGIHSGGMVLCDRPVIDVVPIEHARMERRTVIQWDKDDCADAGLVKFDLLGLGMLTALDHCMRIIGEIHGENYTLATIPQEDPAVYDMLCDGDAVGVFQVESRAQISTLPRLKPRKFYDLVVEVALIRPGPIQGGSVHPYLRRRSGKEPTTFLHPRLKKSLGRTYGIPLFQEQLMQMMVDLADFTPAQADQLRRAMGSKRSTHKMTAMREAMFAGMARNGIEGEDAELVFRKILAFASYGFPESHAYSFAYLVYASAFFKCHYPAAFTAALLRSQPMGFYSPQSLVADARRHGVETRGVDIVRSDASANLELDDEHFAYKFGYHPRFSQPLLAKTMQGGVAPLSPHQPTPDSAATPRTALTPPQTQGERAATGPAIRLGLSSVRGITLELAERIANERAFAGQFRSIADLARRTGLTTRQLEALATSGALDSLGGSRRAALWAAGVAGSVRHGTIEGIDIGHTAPTLPGMSDAELMAADTWATGVSPQAHPVTLLRSELEASGIRPISHLKSLEHGTRTWTAGIITHRQRPATATGITFLGLEDDTGILNVVCSVGFWRSHKALLRTAPAVRLRGIVEKNEDGVVSFLADGAQLQHLGATSTSRNFC